MLKENGYLILSQNEKRILFQSLVVRCLDLFQNLELEMFDLEVHDYFDDFYSDLGKMILKMERGYPQVDMSPLSIELRYQRFLLSKEIEERNYN